MINFVIALIVIGAVLSATVYLWQRRRGKRCQARWNTLAQWENAPLNNALSVATCGIDKELVNQIRLGGVLAQCGERKSESPYDSSTNRLLEILTANTHTNHTMEETQRLYRAAAALHPVRAARYQRQLSVQLVELLRIDKAAAAAEMQMPLPDDDELHIQLQKHGLYESF